MLQDEYWGSYFRNGLALYKYFFVGTDAVCVMN